MAIKFTPIASSSKANCYILTNSRTSLIIEMGVRLKTLQRAIDYKLSSFNACLCTHGHQDHGRHVKDLIKFGIDCYLSQGTADTLELSGHRVKIIKAKEQFRIGSWTILPFDTCHDCEESLGFLLASGNERILFATDTSYIRYRFIGLTHIMIECNYQLDILNENIKNGSIDHTMKSRLLHSHFSLANVCKMLKANDLRRLKEVWLLHLSHENSDAEHMRRTIAEITGTPVYVAEG